MNEAPQYANLRDYLRVLRQQRALIVVVALVFAGAALALAIRQTPKYEAVASVNFTDETQGLDLVGTPVSPRQSALERAVIGAGRLRRPVVAERVRRSIRTTLTSAQLLGMIDSQVRPNATLVDVRATSTDPAFAARVANAFVREGSVVVRREARQRFGEAARIAERRFRAASRRADPFSRSLLADRIGRLRFLSQTAKPVEILDRATEPTRPVSPRPVRNTLLGALLGLTVGLLLAFGRDSLDRRLHGSRDIESELGWPVIGHVREQALGMAGPVRSDVSPNAEDVDLEAFRILRQNLEFLAVDHPPKSVVVTSALPEEGKSTVAASLACAYAVNGRRTLLVECDLRRPTLATRLRVEREPGLVDYLLGDAVPGDVVQVVSLGAEYPSVNGAGPTPVAGPTLAVITAGRATARPAELLGSERMGEFFDQVTQVYDAVIVDTCPLLSVVDTIEMIPRVAGVLMCVRATHTTREQARAAHEAISRAPERPVGVVVTGMKPGDEREFAYYGYAYAYTPSRD